VGGPCLPINSYQLLNTARRTGVKLSIIESGRMINETMPDHVVKLTIDAFNESQISIEKSNILILGVSYKPNVKDIQLSPAKHIIKKFQNLGIIDESYRSVRISTIDEGLILGLEVSTSQSSKN